MSNKKNYVCSVCSKSVSTGAKIKKEVVCESCVLKIASAFSKQKIKKNAKNLNNHNLTPKKIISELDKHIIGQDEAKRVLSVAACNHILRVNHNLDCYKNKDLDRTIEKSNILLLGPTGVGKTAMIKQLARLINVPFVITDATDLTAAGYAGKDVDSILKTLISNADNDVKLAEKGIVFIDEFDKLSRKSGDISATRDIGGEAVQQALLKMIEGDTVYIDNNSDMIISSSTKIKTHDILFVLGGAFEGIYKENKKANSIGFTILNEDEENSSSENEDISFEDLKEFGILPEILGRAPVFCRFNKLSKEDLKEILVKPKNSIIKQTKRMLQLYGVDLVLTSSGLDKIADLAYKNKTGARSLKGIVEQLMHDVYVELPSPKITKVIIDKESIVNKKPKLVNSVEKKKEEV